MSQENNNPNDPACGSTPENEFTAFLEKLKAYIKSCELFSTVTISEDGSTATVVAPNSEDPEGEPVTYEVCLNPLKGATYTDANGEEQTISVTDGVIDLSALIHPTPIEVPAEAFADPVNPTTAEAAAWVAANHSDAQPGTHFYYPGEGSAEEPDYVWEGNGGTTGIHRTYDKACCPKPPVEIPADAFADPAAPTQAEVDAWVAANHPDAPIGQHFYYNAPVADGEDSPPAGDPDYVYESNGPGAGTHNVESPGKDCRPPVEIPADLFEDLPTQEDIDVWVAANHPDAPIGQHFYFVGQGSAGDPDYVYESNGPGAGTHNIESPGKDCRPPVEIPAEAFADPASPTQAEVDAWVSANHSDAPIGQHFYYNLPVADGEDPPPAGDPDYVYESNGPGAGTHNVESPAEGCCEKEVIEIPAEAFADPFNPTSAEIQDWIDTNGNGETGQQYVYNEPAVDGEVDADGNPVPGNTSTTAPDYVFQDNGGTHTQIQCPTSETIRECNEPRIGLARTTFKRKGKPDRVIVETADTLREVAAGNVNIQLDESGWDAIVGVPQKVAEVEINAPCGGVRPFIMGQLHMRGGPTNFIRFDGFVQSTFFAQVNGNQDGLGGGGLVGINGPIVFDTVGRPSLDEKPYYFGFYGRNLVQGSNMVSLWWNPGLKSEWNAGEINLNQYQLQVAIPIIRCCTDF